MMQTTWSKRGGGKGCRQKRKITNMFAWCLTFARMCLLTTGNPSLRLYPQYFPFYFPAVNWLGVIIEPLVNCQQTRLVMKGV